MLLQLPIPPRIYRLRGFLRINNRSSFYFSEHGRGEGLRAFAETGREYNSIPSKTRYRRALPTGST